MVPVERLVAPIPGREYRQVGVHWWGKGTYEREMVDGGVTRYKTLGRIEAGDIIINKIWTRNGALAVVPDELAGCFCSSEFPIFAPKRDRLIPEWFHWLAQTRLLWDQCDEKSRGTSGKNRIKPERFLEVTIPLPPLPEQRRIVARIEELAGKVNGAASTRLSAARATAPMAAAAARSLLVSAGTARHCPLRECVEVVGGGTPSKSNPLFWSGTFPWITPKDMKVREMWDASTHISNEALNHSAAKRIEPGAVLVVVRGMILVHTFPSAVLRVGAAINQDMKALVPDDTLLPDYLTWVFWAHNSDILSLVGKSGHDTRKLETERLLSFEVPVPTIAEQRCIVEELDALQAKVDELKRLQAETQAELDALLPSILARAFSGEL